MENIGCIFTKFYQLEKKLSLLLMWLILNGNNSFVYLGQMVGKPFRYSPFSNRLKGHPISG